MSSSSKLQQKTDTDEIRKQDKCYAKENNKNDSSINNHNAGNNKKISNNCLPIADNTLLMSQMSTILCDMIISFYNFPCPISLLRPLLQILVSHSNTLHSNTRKK